MTMKQRVITGIFFTIAILAFVVPGYFSPYFLAILWAAVAVIICREMILCVTAKKMTPGQYLCYAGASFSILPVVTSLYSDSALLAFGIFALAIILLMMNSVLILVLFQPGEHAFGDGIATAGIELYVSFPLACANITALFIPHGWFFVVIGLFAPWVSDVFAYFTGSIFGKHKIVPHISPKKTVEGCIGGAIGCAGVMVVFFLIFMDRFIDTSISRPLVLVVAALIGIILSVVSQMGDWMASAIKRWAGIKDFGRILPGHGGLLDRFDSAFFTLPVVFALALFFR